MRVMRFDTGLASIAQQTLKVTPRRSLTKTTKKPLFQGLTQEAYLSDSAHMNGWL